MADRSVMMDIRALGNQMMRSADAVTARYGGAHFTGMQSFVLSFIHRRQELGQDVFQKDIEKEFYLSRSTVSAMLSLMEKNGLLVRKSVPQDARLKKLELTDSAARMMESIRRDLDWMDEEIAGRLTPEEQAQMRVLLEKMWNGMESVSLELGLDRLDRPQEHRPE